MAWLALPTVIEPGSGSGPRPVSGVGVNPPLPLVVKPPTTPIQSAVRSPLLCRAAAWGSSELTITPALATVTSPLLATDKARGAWRSSRQMAQGGGPVTGGPRTAAASALI